MGCVAPSRVVAGAAGPPRRSLEAPPELLAYVAAAKERLCSGEAVIPCQQTGGLHSNWAGSCRGFSSEDALRSFNDARFKEISDVRGDILEHWQELDADFVLQQRGLAGAAMPPVRKLRPRIREGLSKQAAMYQKAMASLPESELCRLKTFECLWPSGCAESLRREVMQPEEATTMRLTYAAGVVRMELLYLFALSLAHNVGETAKQVQWSVKRPLRLWRKTIETFPENYAKGDFRRCTDVYRCSLSVHSLGQVEQLLQLLEGLGRRSPTAKSVLDGLGLGGSRASIVVERIKNRFVSPCIGGYMDVSVSLRIDGYVCELQIQLQHLAALRGDAGRSTYKWFRAFQRETNEYVGERMVDGRMHGSGTYQAAAGGRYQGAFEHGKRHGRGVFYHINGDRYEGDFVEGKKHGTGTYYYASGDRYRGGFVSDQMEGFGTYYCANGDRFEGDYAEGKRHGTGVYYYRDGTVYKGDWWNNKFVSIIGV